MPGAARRRNLTIMSRPTQIISALLLLVMGFTFAHAGVKQCLCTGSLAVSAAGTALVCDQVCEEAPCCAGHRGDGPQRGDKSPEPCDDGDCWVLITLDAVESGSAKLPEPGPIPPCEPAAAANGLPALPTVSGSLASGSLPPESCGVGLTILYSSFLI